MTATEELRRMLDERGESWHKWPDDDSTTWQAYSNPHTATESMDGTLIVTGLTPEQAVEATMGRGTCRMCKRKGYDREYLHHYECSECGEEVLRSSVMGESEPPRFCPECGRRVEQ